MIVNMNRILLGFSVLCVAFVMQGCDGGKPPAGEQAEKTVNADDKKGRPEQRLLPFRLAFRTDGTIVFLDEKGNIEEWSEAEFPMKTEALYKLESMSFAFIKGSCTVVTVVNNAVKTKTYPSAVCKYLGIPEN